MSRWRYFNENPTGRVNVGDCSVRAVSVALGVDWETAFALIANNAFQMGDMPSSNSVIGSVLRQNGFYRHIVPNSCPDCFTLEEFAEEHQNGIYVVFTNNHVVTIRDGVILDSWDSSNETPIFYWSKRKDER